jgi:cation diffusion facilitator family transporter
MAEEEHASSVAVVAALLANVGVMAAKVAAFAVTGSGAMLAEAVHSMADTGNEGVLLAGLRRSHRRPDPRHPFGYGGVRFVGAFVVAVVLFGVGAVFSVADGVDKLLHPRHLEDLGVALGVVGVALVLEALSFRNAVSAANRTRGARNWWAFLRVTRQAEVAVLLVEDTAALVGLLIAAVTIALSAATGSPVYDAVGSLGIGAVLAFNAIVLGIEMTSLLVGETADPVQLALVRQALAATPGVDQVIHVRAVHVGPDELLVGAKVTFLPGTSAEEAAVVVDDAEVAVRSAVPWARWIYVEPGRH